jgi:Ceramidase
MPRYWRLIVLILIASGSLLAIIFMPAVPQDTSYHAFADDRKLWGIPNVLNVLSNIPMFIVGVLGLIYCVKQPAMAGIWSWRVFFGAVIFISAGSAYYHWAPNNWTLFWDRLPMAIGFMALFVALLSEFLHDRFEVMLLILLCLLGIASVIYWHFTDDLRFYAWVQFFPLLFISIVFLLYKERSAHQSYLFAALGLYILAKVAEVFDKSLFAMTHQQLSGHSLKHLLSVVAVYILYLRLRRIHLMRAMRSSHNILL